MTITARARDVTFDACIKLFANAEELVAAGAWSGPNQGNWFELDLLRHVEPTYFYGTFGKDVLRAIAARDLRGKVVWDCSTYLGFYTVFVARMVGPGRRVVAFEPDPRNLVRARANCARNRVQNVSFHQVAIGGPVGKTEFLISDVETNSHLLGAYIDGSQTAYEGDDHVTRKIRISCVSLDELVGDPAVPKPDLVKLDIEGAELIALDYLRQLTTDVRPLIVLELHNPECDGKAWEFGQEFGYRLRSLKPAGPVNSAADVRGTLLCEPL